MTLAQPDLKHQVTRTLCLPVKDRNGNIVGGLFQKIPCTMHITAWTPGEASAMADQMKADTEASAWGSAPNSILGNLRFEVAVPSGKTYTLVHK